MGVRCLANLLARNQVESTYPRNVGLRVSCAAESIGPPGLGSPRRARGEVHRIRARVNEGEVFG